MQKRTNPLELKVESKEYTPAEGSGKTVTVTPVVQEEGTDFSPEAFPPVQAVAPDPVAEPAPLEIAEEPLRGYEESAAKEEEPVTSPEAEMEMPNVEPQAVQESVQGGEDTEESTPTEKIKHGEMVADNDVSVAVRFRLSGKKIKRRMVMTRVSSDVCRLAQALYPDQKLGTILENALLTRTFLQDRDAFDAMAREIVKKGGKIKC